MLETPFTVRGIADEASDVLVGFTRDQDQRTSLALPIGDSDLTFQVARPELITRGLVEIGEELVYASNVNPTTGVVTVEPWGRGQQNTPAVAHEAGEKITMSPVFPLRSVGRAVAHTLREIFPHLWAVDETFLDINPARTNYGLPEDAYMVLSAEWLWPGPSQMWAPVERWRTNRPPSGLEIEIISATWPGAGRVRVSYAKRPKAEWLMADDLGDYGYDHEIRDVVMLGAVARTMTYVDPTRTQLHSVVAHARSEGVREGAAADSSRHFYSLFRQRLDEERTQILIRHPIQPHRTR